MAATRKQHSTQPTGKRHRPAAARAEALYMALELGWNEWKLAFATGPGDNPRSKTIAGRDTQALLHEIGKAKKRFRLADELIVAAEYSGGTLQIQENYSYDVFGNRVEQDVTQNGTTTVTKYLFDQAHGNALADLNSNNQVQTVRVYLDKLDAAIARINSDGSKYWYLVNQIGSVTGLMNSSGSLADAITYNAFGTILSETAPSIGDALKYAGGQWDSNVGLEQFNARWYDSTSARWVSQDPMGFQAGDTNLYRYVSNAPTESSDPTGLWQWSWTNFITGAAYCGTFFVVTVMVVGTAGLGGVAGAVVLGTALSVGAGAQAAQFARNPHEAAGMGAIAGASAVTSLRAIEATFTAVYDYMAFYYGLSAGTWALQQRLQAAQTRLAELQNADGMEYAIAEELALIRSLQQQLGLR